MADEDTKTMTLEEKVAAKGVLMRAIGEHYAKIQTAREAVQELEAAASAEIQKFEVAASADIQQVIKMFPRGPHKLPIPGKDDMIVDFRRRKDKGAHGEDLYRMSVRILT
jgi:hypothetical protein